MKTQIYALLISLQLASMAVAQLSVDEFSKEQLIESCSIWNRHMSYKEIESYVHRSIALGDDSGIQKLLTNRNYNTRCITVDVLLRLPDPKKKEIIQSSLKNNAIWVVPMPGELASSHDSLLARFTELTKSIKLEIDREKLSEADYRQSLIKELEADGSNATDDKSSSGAEKSAEPQSNETKRPIHSKNSPEHMRPESDKTSTGRATWVYVLGGAAALALIVFVLRIIPKK